MPHSIDLLTARHRYVHHLDSSPKSLE